MLPLFIIWFVVCHAAPATHFSEQIIDLREKGYHVEVAATGPGYNKLIEKGIDAHQFDPSNLTSLAKRFSSNQIVITDCGDIAIKELHSILEQRGITHLAYYDNPESFVPGGYSKTAAEILPVSSGVIFANKHLADRPLYTSPDQPMELANIQKFGLGYYPYSDALKIRNSRISNQLPLRQKFFSQHNIEDQGQQLIVYYGGNNNEYYQKAFPCFLKILADASADDQFSAQTIVIFQQHPGAKKNNIDGKMLNQWLERKRFQLPIVVSTMDYDSSQILADAVCYYQTSMSPMYALAEIPLAQIAHVPYLDCIVANGLCPSINTSQELIAFVSSISDSQNDVDLQSVLETIGYDECWINHYETILQSFME